MNENNEIVNSIKMETFKVRATLVKHRRNVESDYAIVVNSHIKECRGLGKYAVVQNIFKNRLVDKCEWRTLAAFGKVIVDNTLKDDEIAIDQTIRNAIGMEFNNTNNETVKLYSLERTICQKIISAFRSGQFICLRVNFPALNDMEKKLCRISPDSAKLINSNDGNSIWLECCVSDFRRELNCFISETIDEKNMERYMQKASKLDEFFSEVELPTELYINNDLFKGKKNIEYIKALVETLISFNVSSEDDKKFYLMCKKIFHSIISFGEWMKTTKYSLVDEKITAYKYNSESEKEIQQFQRSHDTCISFEERYPDSDKIFNMSPDLETIRLDKYYRDMLNLNILDSVKVKRRWIESLRDDIIEYGLVFILTIFAAVVAVTPENRDMLIATIPISIIFTMIIMYIRNK